MRLGKRRYYFYTCMDVSYVSVGNANDKRQDVKIRIYVHSNRVF